jgi:hypothetical protein
MIARRLMRGTPRTPTETVCPTSAASDLRYFGTRGLTIAVDHVEKGTRRRFAVSYSSAVRKEPRCVFVLLNRGDGRFEEASLDGRRGDGVSALLAFLTDAVCAFQWLFAGGAAPGCIAALDTNGDAKIELNDSV